MLKAAFAEGKFDLERCPTRLLPGIYEFGRSLLKFEDMRVSRSQIQMDVWPDRVSVTRVRKGHLKVLHPNSCLSISLLTHLSRHIAERKKFVLCSQVWGGYAA
jgi:hypothetical protein